MQRFFENKYCFLSVFALFTLAFLWNLGHGSAAFSDRIQLISPAATVAHGATAPPDPWDGVKLAHGATAPPDPWDGVKLAHGATAPPDPWDGVKLAHGATAPPDPWDGIRG